MNSPLQGGRKRGLRWDGPWITGRPPRRRRRLRRLLAVAAGVVAGLGAWLALGTAELADSARLGAVGVVPQPNPAATGSAAGGPDGSVRSTRAEAVAVSLAVENRLRVNLDEPPAAGLVFDLDSGKALWQRSAREERPIASLTKIMTALLAAEDMKRPERRMKIAGADAGAEASGGVLGSAIGLEPGMRVRLGALYQAMLISSANDAATALAHHNAGSTARFVRKMNRRARRLELDCTRFVSPHGYEPANRSCAADLAALTRIAMDEPRVARVARRERAVVDFPIEGGKRHLATTNPLLRSGYDGVLGLKTGFTQQAGSSLAGVVRRDGRTLGVILLDSPNVEQQAMRLLDAAFAGRTVGG